jgi:peptide/nickel transport system ATP-binding protein
MDESSVIDVANLRIAFAGAAGGAAVNDLSFSLGRSRTLAIVGESGSGKSLTALALMGLLPKQATWSGEVVLRSGDAHYVIKPDGPAELWRGIRGNVVSMVFQEPMSALNPVMKVGKQLSEAIAAHGSLSGRKSREMALQWMGKVQLPDPQRMYHRYPHQLSGGQKQRVMIAMAMCSHPALLIADEPTTALDVTVQREILSLMRELQAESGTAMIFITHDLALAAEMADDVLVLQGGQVMEYGTAKTVLQTPQHPYTRALLACRPGAAAKGKKLPVVADFLNNSVAVEPQPLPPVKLSNNVLLSVRHLRVWFPSQTNLFGTPTHFHRAVEDVSFDLNQGEVLGLVGESGCGKSTISRALMGLQTVESGQVVFDGRDLVHMTASGWRAMRRDVQMIFQDPYSSLNPRLTIGEAIREPLLVHGIVPQKEVESEARRLMGLVQLPEDSLQRYPHQFSGGQRQRIGIARALALRPKLIICDESVSALDVSVQAQILNLLKELQAEFRLSYLFISHDLNVVHYMADRVLVMQSGKIVERGNAEEVLKQPQHAYTQRLVAAVP